MEAAQYYSNHLEEVTNAIMSFDKTEAQSIVECRELLDNVEMKVSLGFIANQFAMLLEQAPRRFIPSFEHKRFDPLDKWYLPPTSQKCIAAGSELWLYPRQQPPKGGSN